MSTPIKLNVVLPTTSSYVRLVSGMFPGGLTKKEMEIVIILMHFLKQYQSPVITQEIKEKTRLYFKFNSQTMHNYMQKLKNKKVLQGMYKDYTLNKLFNMPIELVITCRENETF